MYKHTFNLHQDVKQICVQPLKAFSHLPALRAATPSALRPLLCHVTTPVFRLGQSALSLSRHNPSLEGEPMVTSPSSDALSTVIDLFIPSNRFRKLSPPRLFFQKGYQPFGSGTASLHLRLPELGAARHLPQVGSPTDTPGRLHAYHI